MDWGLAFNWLSPKGHSSSLGTSMPAVLVEIGFLTGRLDSRRLEKKNHRKRLAYAIAKGILEYLYKVG